MLDKKSKNPRIALPLLLTYSVNPLVKISLFENQSLQILGENS